MPDEDFRKDAMSIYTPPFRYEHGYIFDSKNHVVADQGSVSDDEPSVANTIGRVRGWGRIAYMKYGAKLQDEIGAVMVEALNDYWSKSAAATPVWNRLSVAEVRDLTAMLWGAPCDEESLYAIYVPIIHRYESMREHGCRPIDPVNLPRQEVPDEPC